MIYWDNNGRRIEWLWRDEWVEGYNNNLTWRWNKYLGYVSCIKMILLLGLLLGLGLGYVNKKNTETTIDFLQDNILIRKVAKLIILWEREKCKHNTIINKYTRVQCFFFSLNSKFLAKILVKFDSICPTYDLRICSFWMPRWWWTWSPRRRTMSKHIQFTNFLRERTHEITWIRFLHTPLHAHMFFLEIIQSHS